MQEGEDLFGCVRHFGCQRQLGVVFEAEQFGGFQRVCKRLFDVGRVVEFAFVRQFAGTGNVGAVDLFAQFAVVGVLDNGEVVRNLQADFIACFAFALRGGGKHGDGVFGDAGKRRGIVKVNAESVGRVLDVLCEFGTQLRAFGLQLR